MSTLFVCCKTQRDWQYSGVKPKIRIDGQTLQTETFVFEFSKLVTLLCIFLVAIESYEGLNCTVLEQYLEFFKTTKQLFRNYMNFMAFEFRFLCYPPPTIDSPEISRNVFKPKQIPHPRFFPRNNWTWKLWYIQVQNDGPRVGPVLTFLVWRFIPGGFPPYPNRAPRNRQRKSDFPFSDSFFWLSLRTSQPSIDEVPFKNKTSRVFTSQYWSITLGITLIKESLLRCRFLILVGPLFELQGQWVSLCATRLETVIVAEAPCLPIGPIGQTYTPNPNKAQDTDQLK